MFIIIFVVMDLTGIPIIIMSRLILMGLKLRYLKRGFRQKINELPGDYLVIYDQNMTHFT